MTFYKKTSFLTLLFVITLPLVLPSDCRACKWNLLPFPVFPPPLLEPLEGFLSAAERYVETYQRKGGRGFWKVFQDPVATEIFPIVESYRLLKERYQGFLANEGIRNLPDYKDHTDEWEQLITESNGPLQMYLEAEGPSLLEKILALRLGRTSEFYLDLYVEQGSPGTGLACAQLMEAYMKFAASQGYQMSIVQIDYYIGRERTNHPMINHVVLHFHGESKSESYVALQHEQGIHRFIFVQRDKKRTAPVRVSLFPVPDKNLLPDFVEADVKIEFLTSEGPGGQSVNKTQMAVRATHLPSGLSVVIQNERSQSQNREIALKILKARVLQHQKEIFEATLRAHKRQAVTRTGRNIRTYNATQQGGIVVDESGVTAQLNDILKGDMREFLIRVDENRKAETLAQLTEDLEYLTNKLEKEERPN